MKKTLLLLFTAVLVLSLCACGAAETAAIDVQNLYADMTALEGMPEMLAVPADKALTLLGLSPEDCAQSVTAICADSLRADEIWLVEAVDDAAADRIAKLAQTRLDQKAQELKDYLPEQYQVVQNGTLIVKGRLVALLISPQAEKLESLFNGAAGA